MVFLTFWQVCSDSINFFQKPLMFPSSREQVVVAWGVGWGGEGFETLEYCRMNVPLPNVEGVILTF